MWAVSNLSLGLMIPPDHLEASNRLSRWCSKELKPYRAALSKVLSGFRNFKRLLCLPTKSEEVNIRQNTVLGFGRNSVFFLGMIWGWIDLFLGFWKILDSDWISVVDRNWELGSGTKFKSKQQNLHICHDSPPPGGFHPPALNSGMAHVESGVFFKPSGSQAASPVDHTFTRCPERPCLLSLCTWQAHLRLITLASQSEVIFSGFRVWK